MSQSFYKIRQQDETLIFILDSLGDGNALTLEKLECLIQDLKSLRPSLVCITNQGPSFCAGGNLRFYQALATREEGLEVNRQIRAGLDEFQKFPAYKVALVDGLCLGGGIEFLACFDQVLATSRALFGLWQRRIGLTYGWGGESRLRQRVSDKALKGWLLRADTLSSYEAHRLGLVDQVLSWRCDLAEMQKGWQRLLRIAPETLQAHLQSQDGAALFDKLWLEPAHRRALINFNVTPMSGRDVKPAGEGE
jgi:enoyl-CoA hydratase/carnithine racemase